MVDPNRKINRLTDRDLEFLEECEREFSLRYTQEDEEFMDHCSKPLPDPPIVDNWSFGGGGGGSGGGGDGGRNHHQHRGGNRNQRGWRGHGGGGGGGGGGGNHRNFRPRQRGGGGRGRFQNGYEGRDRDHTQQGGYRREQPYPNHPPMNVRRDYGNFVAASKD